MLYQDLATLSIVDISCDNFEYVFSRSLKKKVIRDNDSISKISASISRTIQQKNYAKSINVRIKMIMIYQSKKNDTICSNASVISVNNKIYRIDRDFSNLLIKLTGSKYFFDNSNN